MTVRSGRRRRQQNRLYDQPLTMTQPRFTTPMYHVVDEETLHLIHQRSMTILSDIGIAFLDDEAQEILRANGVKVIDDMAYFDPEQVMALIAQAPSSFTLLARNSEHHVVIGDDYLSFAPVYGPPFVLDIVGGRRSATMDDLRNFIKLTNACPYLHHGGGIIAEPSDESVTTRHLDITYAHIINGDKGFMGSSIGRGPAADVIAMAEILYGAEAIRENPALLITINASSPRQFDDRMLGAMIVNARARQAVMVTPFILSGAMGPVSIAGTVAQLNAEALAGLAFLQLVNPGVPMVYGSFQTTVDLKSGAPVLGGPEAQLAVMLSKQLAYHYNLPFRGSAMYASSKISDAQAGYESVMSMLPGIFTHTHFVLHAAGWLESGLVAGYEKFMLDCEILGMIHKFLKPLDLSDDGFAMASIKEVPPGGHHFGTEHTMRHMKDAFYRAELFDYKSAEQWEEEGAKDATLRAHAKYKHVLNTYTPPALDSATDEALNTFIRRRKQEILTQEGTL